jgi:hypothetical protein
MGGDHMVSPRRAAQMLGIHVNTVRTWCLRTEKGQKSRLPNATRHPGNGYFQVPVKDINAIKNGKKDEK